MNANGINAESASSSGEELFTPKKAHNVALTNDPSLFGVQLHHRAVVVAAETGRALGGLVRATDGKKVINTMLSAKNHQRFQAAYATVLKAHMDALKKRERKDRKDKKGAKNEKKIVESGKKTVENKKSVPKIVARCRFLSETVWVHLDGAIYI
eukprot:Gb_00267 [translate_table: standard]